MAEYDWGCVPKGQTKSTSEFIDKGELTRRIYQRTANDKRIHIECMATFINLVNAQPTADVVEVVHGEWVEKDVRVPLPRDYPPRFGEDSYDLKTHSIIEKWWFCSECNYEADRSIKPHYNYCPNCGAKMDERREDERIN